MPPKGLTNNPRGLNGHSPALASLRELARTHTQEAISTIMDIMRSSGDDSLRLEAAEAILDRAWGKPSQQIDLLRQDLQVITTLSREDLLELAPAAMALLGSSE